MKRHPWATGWAALILLAAVVVLGRHRIHFDLRLFRSQLALVDWRLILLAITCVYASILVRSLRWIWLLRHRGKIPLVPLLSAQMIGFAAVALLGRAADLTRPYLIARKTGLPAGFQFAVYFIERLFDAAILAFLFGGALLFSGSEFGFLRKAALAALIGAVAGTLFLVVLRLAGSAMTAHIVRGLMPLSKKFALATGHKLHTFQAGLDAMRSVSDVIIATLLSAGLWGLIATAYLVTTRAFVTDPRLVTLSFAECVPLLALSSGASFFQLPVLGWFSQIGLVAAGMSAIYRVPAEVSTAWSAALLLVTFLSPLPVGLLWAQVQGVNLRKVTTEASTQARTSA
ncbi:MAG: lysylphosphatidylglycerol synthase transmembrane domain-containing protein [Acidobacteriota bacterium]